MCRGLLYVLKHSVSAPALLLFVLRAVFQPSLDSLSYSGTLPAVSLPETCQLHTQSFLSSSLHINLEACHAYIAVHGWVTHVKCTYDISVSLRQHKQQCMITSKTLQTCRACCPPRPATRLPPNHKTKVPKGAKTALNTSPAGPKTLQLPYFLLHEQVHVRLVPSCPGPHQQWPASQPPAAHSASCDTCATDEVLAPSPHMQPCKKYLVHVPKRSLIQTGRQLSEGQEEGPQAGVEKGCAAPAARAAGRGPARARARPSPGSRRPRPARPPRW